MKKIIIALVPLFLLFSCSEWGKINLSKDWLNWSIEWVWDISLSKDWMSWSVEWADINLSKDWLKSNVDWVWNIELSKDGMSWSVESVWDVNLSDSWIEVSWTSINSENIDSTINSTLDNVLNDAWLNN